ncbi:MAG: hypothetical protein U5L00_21390 [Desulfovermiculus sp.]|nr:hypothetical protein [Desulfovermiculus sp.]
MRASGLTLIELLLVLGIIGLGWFTLLPKLDGVPMGPEARLDKVNTLLFQAGQEALQSHARQRITLTLGSTEVRWKEQEARLPAPISRVHINGRQAAGTRPGFAVYPTGHMDELNLRLQDGELLQSRPLARELRFRP